MNDGLRSKQQHTDCRNGKRPEGKRRAIDHDADEDDCNHDEGALGGNLNT